MIEQKNKKLLLIVTVLLSAGILRMTTAQTPKRGLTKTGLPKMQMGSYIELDESIKDEPYEGTIDFPDAELTDIVTAISKVANKNFILDGSLKGKRITIMSPQKVTKEEAYNVFLTSLFMNGLTVVSSGKYLRVIQSREAPKSNVRVFYGDFVPASDEIVTLVYPLKNISSEDMPRIFQDLLPRTGNILVYPETNSVIMTDSGLNLRRMISILKSVDVPGSQPKLESIPINYASAKDVANLIEEILDAQTAGSNRRTTSSRLQKEKKIQGGGVITKIVPDERTNSLVVLANGKGVEQLRSLIAKLDSPNASNSGNIHIYFVRNALAEDLATTMNNLLSGATSSSSVPTRADAVPPPNPFNAVANRTTPTRNVVTGGEGVALEGQVKVVADKATNSLVVRASGANYASLKKILERLDIPRRQVNVEATIMEIKVRDADRLNIAANLGVDGFPSIGGFIPSTFDKAAFASAVASPAALTGIVAGIAGGKNIKISDGNGGFRDIPSFIGLIQAIQDLQLGQIMQQPNILTSDNEPGLVNITEKLKVQGPIQVQAGATAGQTITTSTPETAEVILELKVTPQIGEDNNLVKLKVEQSMADYAKSINVNGQVDIVTRKANTVVVVRDGDTVVIGGLEKNDYKSLKSKVPLLGDLPILGTLFRGTDTEKVRSNLMLFLTPKIIRDNTNLLELTDLKLRKRQKDGKDAYDPKDFHRKEISRMLKDTDERIKGKKGWGFRSNTSAYLQDQSPAYTPAPAVDNETPLPDDEPLSDTVGNKPAPKETKSAKNSTSATITNDDLDLLPADAGESNGNLPPASDLNDSSNPDAGLETLDIR